MTTTTPAEPIRPRANPPHAKARSASQRAAALVALLTGALSACATRPYAESSAEDETWRYVENDRFAAIAEAKDTVDKDRLAILAMLGEHRVTFRFEETVELAAAYDRREGKNSGGFEAVILIDDEPGFISLQHILVAPGGGVVKHWRQDWTYEATERFEFAADQAWDVVALDPAQSAGAWTQCVFEVSDAPRYCGTGRWNHRYGVSTWTSDRSWRPLPRREYTKRDDYNALNVENRHTVTARGWTHEQDNTKAQRDGRRTTGTLVREFGFNDYRRIEGHDFGPGYDYWSRSRDYWAQVRRAWAERLHLGRTLVLATEVDGMPIIQGTFAHAAEIADAPPAEQRQAIETLLDEWTRLEEPERAAQVFLD